MGGTELLRSFDDFIGSVVTPRIDVACRELLTVTDSAAGLDDIDHVVARSEQLSAVRRSDATRGRRGTAVVINNQRIFLVRVEIGRQTHHTLYLRAIGSREVPLFRLAQLYPVEDGLHRIGKQGGNLLLRIIQVSHARAGIASTYVGSHRRIVLRQREVENHILLQRQHLVASGLRGVAIDVLAIAIGRIEVDAVVRTVPLQELNRRVEVTGDGLHLLRSQVHDERLRIELIGDGMIAAVLTDAVEGCRATRNKKLLAVR